MDADKAAERPATKNGLSRSPQPIAKADMYERVKIVRILSEAYKLALLLLKLRKNLRKFELYGSLSKLTGSYWIADPRLGDLH